MNELVQKPWGHEEIWAHTLWYVGKILFVKKGHRLSKQYHKFKVETLRIITGKAIVALFDFDTGEQVGLHVLEPDTDTTTVHITNGTVHRIEAVEDSHIMEVSTTEIWDVVRLEDDYLRLEENIVVNDGMKKNEVILATVKEAVKVFNLKKEE